MKTSNAVEILKRDFSKDAELEKLYEIEKLKDQIARHIQELRAHLNYSSKDLAKQLNISISAVEKLEDADY